MGRRFNVTGSCNPQKHYMVRLDDRLMRIKAACAYGKGAGNHVMHREPL